jgi:hypothetical protein
VRRKIDENIGAGGEWQGKICKKIGSEVNGSELKELKAECIEKVMVKRAQTQAQAQGQGRLETKNRRG